MIAMLLWLIYEFGISTLLQLMGANETLYPYALAYMKYINGFPSFFNEFANGFIVLLFNIQILKYCGESALSVYSVISNCVILFNSLFTGVGQAIQPIVANNYGAIDILPRLKSWDSFYFLSITTVI